MEMDTATKTLQGFHPPCCLSSMCWLKSVTLEAPWCVNVLGIISTDRLFPLLCAPCLSLLGPGKELSCIGKYFLLLETGSWDHSVSLSRELVRNAASLAFIQRTTLESAFSHFLRWFVCALGCEKRCSPSCRALPPWLLAGGFWTLKLEIYGLKGREAFQLLPVLWPEEF